jgi:hypothetical protein
VFGGLVSANLRSCFVGRFGWGWCCLVLAGRFETAEPSPASACSGISCLVVVDWASRANTKSWRWTEHSRYAGEKKSSSSWSTPCCPTCRANTSDAKGSAGVSRNSTLTSTNRTGSPRFRLGFFNFTCWVGSQFPQFLLKQTGPASAGRILAVAWTVFKIRVGAA